MTTEVNNDTAQKNLLSLSDTAEMTVFLYLVNCNLVNATPLGGGARVLLMKNPVKPLEDEFSP